MRDRFDALLRKPESQEREWQALFAAHPFVLTDCLPLQVAPERLIACKPGKAEADFYFYPDGADPLSPFGLVELKRPSTLVLSRPRKDVVCLTADATTVGRKKSCALRATRGQTRTICGRRSK